MWFPSRFKLKGKTLTEKWRGFISGMPFCSHSPSNSSKSDLRSGSLILSSIGAKSNPFSSTLISISVKTFLLKLNTVFEQKYPTKRPSLHQPCAD